jgi:IS5 family transposase
MDSQSGLIHSASVTGGNVHDSQELPNLLRGEETRLHGDSAYRGEKQKKRRAIQGRASVPHAQTHMGLRQGSV